MVLQAKGFPNSVAISSATEPLAERYRNGTYVNPSADLQHVSPVSMRHMTCRVEKVTYHLGRYLERQSDRLEADRTALLQKRARAIEWPAWSAPGQTRHPRARGGHPGGQHPVALPGCTDASEISGPNRIECNARGPRAKRWLVEHGSTIIVFAPPGMSLWHAVVDGDVIRMGQPLLNRHLRGDHRSTLCDAHRCNRLPLKTSVRPVMGAQLEGLFIGLPQCGVVVSGCCTTVIQVRCGAQKTLPATRTAAVFVLQRFRRSFCWRWAGLADTVFQHLAHDNDCPTLRFPRPRPRTGTAFCDWLTKRASPAGWFHFRIYQADPGKTGVSRTISYRRATDARGVLWIGTKSGGLARYDREHDGCRLFPWVPKG